MKVALDAGDVLDVALLDGDRVIGTLSLQIRDLSGATSRGRATAGASERSTTTRESAAPKKRRARKPLSEETKAKMASAQKARWEQKRALENN